MKVNGLLFHPFQAVAIGSIFLLALASCQSTKEPTHAIESPKNTRQSSSKGLNEQKVAADMTWDIILHPYSGYDAVIGLLHGRLSVKYPFPSPQLDFDYEDNEALRRAEAVYTQIQDRLAPKEYGILYVPVEHESGLQELVPVLARARDEGGFSSLVRATGEEYWIAQGDAELRSLATESGKLLPISGGVLTDITGIKPEESPHSSCPAWLLQDLRSADVLPCMVYGGDYHYVFARVRDGQFHWRCDLTNFASLDKESGELRLHSASEISHAGAGETAGAGEAFFGIAWKGEDGEIGLAVLR